MIVPLITIKAYLAESDMADKESQFFSSTLLLTFRQGNPLSIKLKIMLKLLFFMMIRNYIFPYK